MSTDALISFSNALGNFKPSISLTDAPNDWLREYTSQIFEVMSIHGTERAEVDVILYPRLFAYTLEVLKLCRPELVDGLKEECTEWTTDADDVSLFVNHDSVNVTLRRYLDLCKTAACESRRSLNQTLVDKILKLDALYIAVRIFAALKDHQSRNLLLGQNGPRAQSLLDLIQELLDLVDLGSIRSSIVKTAVELSKNSALHPKCLVLRNVNIGGTFPVDVGGFGDIYMGEMGGQVVAVKRMRIFGASAVEALTKVYSGEAALWAQLSNPYVLPFYGVYYLPEPSPQLCLVSPWMENGALTIYLKNNPQANRLSLMLDIALGIEYLHNFDPPVIHGNLTGSNILITAGKSACVAGFTLAILAQDSKIPFTPSSDSNGQGSLPWMAPELLGLDDSDDPQKGCKSRASDIYAFGCVCYEMYSGRPPFSELPSAMILVAKLQNQRPSRPSMTEPDDAIWALIKQCWGEDPASRPCASEVVQKLGSHAGACGRKEHDWGQNKAISRNPLSTPAGLPSITPGCSERDAGHSQSSYFTYQEPDASQISDIPSPPASVLAIAESQQSTIFGVPWERDDRNELLWQAFPPDAPAAPNVTHEPEDQFEHAPPATESTRTPYSRNIVVFGEIGAGKSSLINMIVGSEVAATSQHTSACTLDARDYDVHIASQKYRIYDTVGPCEGKKPEQRRYHVDALEKAYRLVMSMAAMGGIHLLIFCFRAGRLTEAVRRTYSLFSDFLCESKVPVALVITHTEAFTPMEDWWIINQAEFTGYGIRPVAHACITTIPGVEGDWIQQRRYEESRTKVHELLQKYGAGKPFMKARVFWTATFTIRAPRHSMKGMVQYLTRNGLMTKEDAEAFAKRIKRVDSDVESVVGDARFRLFSK
ncbi:kinase-like protein [Leucogyrophana mollusca]|uniref:Kinase-like protein n=1 Tax=Leucogyrophana mollusca TaxID=85980 RepID=A0ACB8B7H7_9AGAM|nr:kinase-like protein [Leucogyrophana mollusca]